MSNLQKWQDKIKQKRSKTKFRDFLKEIVSWSSVIFYKNNGLISRYPESDRIRICSIKEYELEVDNLVKYGYEYNFSLNLFKNFEILDKSISHACLIHLGVNENSHFSDTAVGVKNTYLSNVVTLGSENVFYSILVRLNSKNIFNSLSVVDNSEIIYFSKGIKNSFKIFYSSYINNCNNIWFSSNLIGCIECIFCDGLENLKYCINNKKLEKEDYFEKKGNILKNKHDFLEYYSNINSKGINYNSNKVKGNYIIESENIKNGNFVFNAKNGKNLLYVGSTSGGEDWCDFSLGGEGNKDIFGVNNSGGGATNIYNSVNIGFSSNIYYSKNLENCSYCIGCIGLKNKSYCILNKQYTKDEWEKLSDKIFNQMDSDGILGDFFPGNLNPFYFNDTIAGLIGGFTKEEVVKDGYMWRDDNIKVDIPEGSEVISTNTLDNYQGFNKDGKWEIDKEILKKIIKDKEGNYYRIVEMEYDFLVKHSLPLPEIHWVDRMKLNFGV